MNNEAFLFLKQHIGKEVTQSPSPFMNWLKPKMVSVEEGKLSFEYTIRKEMTNPFGTMHGGVIGAIIDDAIGATLISYGEPHFYVTINNVIDYFASAKENDVIISETAINKKGKTIVNAQCEIWNKERTKLLAKGYTNLLKTDIK
ncbi:Thioesterase superfamily protein [compost metagenome]